MTVALSAGIMGRGSADAVLDDDAVAALLREALAGWRLERKRVVCVVPDGTRTMPLPLVRGIVDDALAGVASSVEWLVALGTHRAMSDAALVRHLGLDAATPGLGRVHNHAFDDPASLVTLDEITGEEMAMLSDGLLRESVPVRVNRRLLDADVALVLGPVFPHEVVGFSGGNKYFFPGLSGPEMIDASHWLGALHTASALIGAPGITPVRRLIDRAAACLPLERLCAAFVLRTSDAAVHGLYLGSCEEAWAAAAGLSARVHVQLHPRAYDTVLAVVPPMYVDLWTGAKGVYKLEPVVADGGELVLYAPHIRRFSETHGDAIARVGYHCRDYFLAHLDRFEGVPLGVLAHGTHVRGLGVYNAETGVEACRIKVTLATAIPEDECHRVGLGWCDPAAIDPATFAGAGRTLVAERAGEVLHRLEGKRLEGKRLEGKRLEGKS